MWQLYSRSLYPEKHLGLRLKMSHCHSHFPVLGLIFAQGKQVGKKLYLTNGKKMSFNGVKALCAQFQASVATPTNSRENQAIQELAGTEAFLGITDEYTEGQFVDLTGKRVRYQNWNDGEPNNADSAEHCVEILKDGKWNDIFCSSQLLAVCEFPA